MIDEKNKRDGRRALSALMYGLYVVTCRDANKDNGFIINTVMQITDNPVKIAVAINKENYSYGIIKKSGIMNVNCLCESAPFSLFENFGFKSGKNTDKFEKIKAVRSKNNLAVLEEHVNAYLSLKTEDFTDLGTHGMFICSVEEAGVILNEKTMTYDYYHNNVKKPVSKKKGYICKICGYVYEGENIPEDFICPICKHTAADFEKIE